MFDLELMFFIVVGSFGVFYKYFIFPLTNHPLQGLLQSETNLISWVWDWDKKNESENLIQIRYSAFWIVPQYLKYYFLFSETEFDWRWPFPKEEYFLLKLHHIYISFFFHFFSSLSLSCPRMRFFFHFFHHYHYHVS